MSPRSARMGTAGTPLQVRGKFLNLSGNEDARKVLEPTVKGEEAVRR